MRKIITIIIFMITTTISAQTGMDSIMLSEINRVRINPKSYIPLVKDYIVIKTSLLKSVKSGRIKYGRINGTKDSNNTFKRSGNVISGTKAISNDIRAARELISLLNRMKPVKELIFCTTMDSISDAQGNYLDSLGKFGHKGPNGNSLSDRFKGLTPVIGLSENVGPIRTLSIKKNFTDIMVELLVDGHVKSRGHRKNLLNPKSKFVSLYVGKKYYVQNFIY